MRGAAAAAVRVVAGLERGGGTAERGDGMTAARVAEQRVERHARRQPGGQRPSLEDLRLEDWGTTPLCLSGLGPSSYAGYGGRPMRAGAERGQAGGMSRTYAELPGLMTLMTGDEKHGPSATSTLDVLWVLYDQVLRVSPDTVDDPGRDRFLLSKGHGPAAYYAVLAAKGFIPESWLADFGSAASPLGLPPGPQPHPRRGDRQRVAGARAAARGRARARASRPRAFRAAGVRAGRATRSWTRAATARRSCTRGAVGLPNLTVVAVDNQSSSYGWGPGGIEAHFAVSGWSSVRVSGRDHAALASAFRVTSAGAAVGFRRRAAARRGHRRGKGVNDHD